MAILGNYFVLKSRRKSETYRNETESTTTISSIQERIEKFERNVNNPNNALRRKVRGKSAHEWTNNRFSLVDATINPDSIVSSSKMHESRSFENNLNQIISDEQHQRRTGGVNLNLNNLRYITKKQINIRNLYQIIMNTFISIIS